MGRVGHWVEALLILVWYGVGAQSEAHLYSVSYGALRIEPNGVLYTLELDPALLRIISLDLKDLHADQGPRDRPLDMERIRRYVLAQVQLVGNRQVCPSAFVGLDDSETDRIQLRVRFRCQTPRHRLILKSQFFLDYDPNHQHVVTVDALDRQTVYVFNAEHTAFDVLPTSSASTCWQDI